MAKKLVTMTTVALLASAANVDANSERYDKSVAAAAAKIAAERLGEIRGSIDFNEKPGIVSHRDAKKTSKPESGQSLIWIPPTPEKETMQRISEADTGAVDQTMTGSTVRTRKRGIKPTFWEWFDGDGNPIDPPFSRN